LFLPETITGKRNNYHSLVKNKRFSITEWFYDSPVVLQGFSDWRLRGYPPSLKKKKTFFWDSSLKLYPFKARYPNEDNHEYSIWLVGANLPL